MFGTFTSWIIHKDSIWSTISSQWLIRNARGGWHPEQLQDHWFFLYCSSAFKFASQLVSTTKPGLASHDRSIQTGQRSPEIRPSSSANDARSTARCVLPYVTLQTNAKWPPTKLSCSPSFPLSAPHAPSQITIQLVRHPRVIYSHVPFPRYPLEKVFA